MGGSDNGVPLKENGAINAGAHLGDDSGVEKGVTFGGVVSGRQWLTGGAATRRMLCRTSRGKVIVVESDVVIIVFVGKSLEGGRSGQRNLVDRSGHDIEVIRIDMGACDPGVTAERNNKSKATVPRGTSRVLLTHMSRGGSGKDVRG